jgi:ABC-type dipeptide/oligopeptide/nickel transport system permease component
MAGYITRRLLFVLPSLLIIYTLAFVVVHSVPGGPWTSSGMPMPAEAYERMKEYYGLNRPLYVQYFDYLGKAVHGDFGPSMRFRQRTVNDMVAQSFPITLQLGLAAFLISTILGLSFGLLGAMKHNSWIDYAIGAIATIGYSTPAYVSALVFILVFSISLHWLPSGGWDGLFSKTSIIPLACMVFGPMALLTRYTRASMLEVLSEDYLRTARAKGLKEKTVIVRHALRNALIPVMTVAGLMLASLMAGSFFVEQLCNIPGMGNRYLESVVSRDYPVIIFTTLSYPFILIMSTLLVDVLYGYFDPRVRYS